MNTVIVPAANDDLAICHPEQTVEVSVSPPDEDQMQTMIFEDFYPKTSFPLRFRRVSVHLTE